MAKNQIYYFTGTGNSLQIARDLSKKVKAEVLSVASSMSNNGGISADSIGIVFPIYMYNAPKMVYEFIKKIKSCDYVYIVMTMGGGSGRTTKMVNSILKKNNLKLSASFSVMMPDNYIVWNDAMKKSDQEKLFSWADARVEEISKVVNDKQEHFDDESSLFKVNMKDALPFPLSIMPRFMFQAFCNMGYSMIPKMAGGFNTNDKCNGCGTCEKICPANNVKMVDKKPVWNKKCEQCFACLQWCPKEAIEFKDKTQGKKRYHNPNVKIAEVLKQRG